MSNPSQSLASRLDWREVFQAIGLDSPRRSDLPQSMPCPCCEVGAMTVMQDHVLHSQWFYCHGCKFAGDLIELVARVQDRPVTSVVDFLETRTLFGSPLSDDDLTNYQTEHLDYRHRINAFWEKASRAPAQRGGMGMSGFRFLRKFGFGDNPGGVWSPDRGGRLFGVSPHQTIEDLFAPSSYEDQERPNREGQSSRRRGGGPGRRRLFQGHDWDEVLVIPHADLPGRIIGFTFIGRDLDNPEFVYKRANLGCCVARPRESGLGFLNAIDGSSHPHFGRYAFVFLNAEIATLLHARHLRDSSRPLPLLLAKHSRDFSLLNLPPDVADRQLIFCGPPLEILPFAKAAHALVSEYQIPDLEIRDNLKRRCSTDFLGLYKRRVVPWVTALNHLMTTASAADLEVLIGRLKLTASQNRELLQGLRGDASERLAHLGPQRIGGKSINVRGQLVEETEGGWSVKKSRQEEIICHWPIRIESIFKSDAANTRYEVAVHCSDKPVKLIIAEAELKHSTLLDLVSGELRKTHGLQLNFTARKWAKASFDMAMQFSDPQIVMHSDRIGWTQERHRFQFPQFSILNGGSIDPTPMPFLQPDPCRPASELSVPYPCREAVARLSRCSPETQIIWALAACVTHNLLAGSYLGAPLGVVLDGQFALETGVSAATALGCGSVDVDRRGNASIRQYVSDECGTHDFLSVVHFPGHSKPQFNTAWLDDPHLRHAILPLPSAAAIAVSSHQGFVRIRAHEYPQPLGLLISPARWIIPAYMANLCRRNMEIRTGVKKNDLLSVLDDMAEWLELLGGAPKAVLAGQEVLAFDSRSPALACVELVEIMRRADLIRSAVSPGGTSGSAKIPVAVSEHSSEAGQASAVQIRLGVINEVLRKQRLPAIHPDEVRADLESLSAWRGAMPGEEEDAWLIDADWWGEQTAAVRKKLRPHSSPNEMQLPNDGPSEREFPAPPTPVIIDSTP